MNQLGEEKSLYLQQHKNNPVHWLPWSQDAFDRAREQQKPVFISIGYSSCHWCHVMEEECFENSKIAAILNEKFICIKVDREEFPDVDGYYMDYLVKTKGHGGWPLNVVCNAEKVPFIGMTYVPHYQLGDVLTNIAQGYATNVHNQNAQFENTFALPQDSIQLTDIPEESSHSFVTQFPQAMYLLGAYTAGHTDFVLKELDFYITRGLFDHIEGGFFRYCVDRDWTIPHFEKMLYDQATLLWLCGVLHKEGNATPTIHYAIEGTLNWLSKMKLENGLYGSATDADTTEGEGYYYTLENPSREARALFDLDRAETHDGRYHACINLDEYAKNRIQACALIEDQRDHRQKRVMPALDQKSICSHNCVLVHALALCDKHKEAQDLFSAIQSQHKKEDQLVHIVYPNGYHAQHEYLEDYAGYLLAATTMEDQDEMVWAKKKIQEFISNELALSSKPEFRSLTLYQDTPFPSGGALALYAADEELASQLLPLVKGMTSLIKESPRFFGLWGTSLLHH